TISGAASGVTLVNEPLPPISMASPEGVAIAGQKYLAEAAARSSQTSRKGRSSSAAGSRNPSTMIVVPEARSGSIPRSRAKAVLEPPQNERGDGSSLLAKPNQPDPVQRLSSDVRCHGRFD